MILERTCFGGYIKKFYCDIQNLRSLPVNQVEILSRQLAVDLGIDLKSVRVKSLETEFNALEC